MDEDAAIPETIGGFVRGWHGVRRAEDEAFFDETCQLVAGVLGLSTEQVERNEMDIGLRKWRAEQRYITFGFPIPDDLPLMYTHPGPPYLLSINRD